MKKHQALLLWFAMPILMHSCRDETNEIRPEHFGEPPQHDQREPVIHATDRRPTYNPLEDM